MIALQTFLVLRGTTTSPFAKAAALRRRKINLVRLFWTWNQQDQQRQQEEDQVGPVTLEYQRRVKNGNANTLLQLDEDQLALCTKLDSLYHSLSASSTKTNISTTRSMMIPDEHLEAAAWYYNASSSSSSLLKLSSRTSLLLSSLSPSSSSDSNENNHFAKGIVYATAHSFVSSASSSSNRITSNGIYIHGSVGVGKSMLMDLFHSICTNGLVVVSSSNEDDSRSTNANANANASSNIHNCTYEPINLRCKRYHFHEFMIHVHQQIHTYKSSNPQKDPIPHVAAQIAKEARLLCFDEMQITDIADAMIIKRILTLLIELGVVIVTTSNRPPSGLYEGGINRSVFLPLVDALMEKLTIVEMNGTRDYRKQEKEKEEADGLSSSSSLSGSSNKEENTPPLALPSYLCTSTTTDVDNVTEILNDWFSKGGGGGERTTTSTTTAREEHLPVAMGRTIHVKKSNDLCAWFDFQELCHQPLGAADYIAIAERYDIVIVENVPQLSGHCYNEARRFVIFIDALYEAKTKVIISADVPRDELFLGFDATAETNDGDEEIAIADATGDTFVLGEGGSSSSSSTTMIRTSNSNRNNNNDEAVEWSATGRIGVSLAQLSAVKEVSFSFKRAESRLAEMSSAGWGERVLRSVK
mmetsp:Transcript_24894/g.59109  ORF Transcript_24894/g.59109 Transcript_24894/m.59109 type:complete len:641 (-) Transcript_24894:114-2036(-)